MSILHQSNLIPQTIIANGLTTGNQVQNPDNLLNTTDSTAIFGASSDVLLGNYPFNLPQEAVIVGIAGVLKARIDNNSIPAGSLTPVLVDSTSGVNEFFPGQAITGLSDVLQEYEFGGNFDIWGNPTWNADKINNLRLQLIANSSIEVAWASLTVFYYIPVVSPVPPPFELPGCENCDSVIQALTFELADVWRTDQTFLTLKSFSLPDGRPITLDMIGDCGGTINCTVDPELPKTPGRNFIENFNIDQDISEITTLDNGYVRIELGSSDLRGLDFIDPYGPLEENRSEHAIGAAVIITNNGPFNGKLLKKCHIGTLVGKPLEVQDEDATVALAVSKMNFRGDPVQATVDPMDPEKVNVDINVTPTNVDPTPGSVSTGTNGDTPTPDLTISHTIAVDENYLRVWISTQDIAISGVTFDGVAMTLVGEISNSGSDLHVALYELVNPNVGTHDIVVTMASDALMSAGGIGFSNVDTANPTDNVSVGNFGTDDAPSDSINTTIDNVVVQDVVGTKTNPTTFTQFGLWTIQGQVTVASRTGASSTRNALIPQSVSDQYGLDAPMDWIIILAGVRGATASPSGGVQSVTGQYIDNTDPANPVSIVPRNNTAGTDPATGNDNTQGYRVDSKWFNSVSGDFFTCTDASTGAAVWVLVTGSSGTPLTVQKDGVDVVTNVQKLNFHGDAQITDEGSFVAGIDILGGSGAGGTKLEIDTTQVTTPSDTAENTIYSINIPGGTLGDNDAVRFKTLFSEVSIGNSPDETKTFRLRYGGTEIASVEISIGSIPSDQTFDSLILQGYIIADNATGAQKGQLEVVAGNGLITGIVVAQAEFGTSAIDSTIDQDLDVTVQSNLSSGLIAEAIIVEKISDGNAGNTIIQGLTAGEDIDGATEPKVVFMGNGAPKTPSYATESSVATLDSSWYDVLFTSPLAQTSPNASGTRRAASLTTPGHSITINHIEVQNLDSNTSTTVGAAVEIGIYTDNAGEPGTLISAFTDASYEIVNDNLYGALINLGQNVVLDPSTVYWVVVDYASGGDPLFYRDIQTLGGLLWNGSAWIVGELMAVRIGLISFEGDIYQSLYTPISGEPRRFVLGITKQNVVEGGSIAVIHDGVVSGYTGLTAPDTQYISTSVPGELQTSSTSTVRIATATKTDEVVISRVTDYQ